MDIGVPAIATNPGVDNTETNLAGRETPKAGCSFWIG